MWKTSKKLISPGLFFLDEHDLVHMDRAVEVQDLFKEMDTDGSGSVDKEEFRAFVKAASAGA